MRRQVRAVFGAVMLLSLAACGVDPDDSLGATTTVAGAAPVVTYAANGKSDSVLAIDNNFLPGTLTVVAGTEVVFDNNGRNAHNVVPADDPQAATWGVLDAEFQPKDTYSYVFTTPGTYVYYCTIHGTSKAGMFGTIVVTEP